MWSVLGIPPLELDDHPVNREGVKEDKSVFSCVCVCKNRRGGRVSE